MNQKIHQRGHFDLIEGPAAATIFPGMMVEQAATGFQAHSTAGGVAEKLFAQEDALQGGTVQGVYHNGAYVGYTVAGINGVGPDMVQVNAEKSGNLVLAILLAGSNYPVGTKLISDGAGRLKPTTGTPAQTIAVIPQNAAINLSASGSLNTLNTVRLL